MFATSEAGSCLKQQQKVREKREERSSVRVPSIISNPTFTVSLHSLDILPRLPNFGLPANATNNNKANFVKKATQDQQILRHMKGATITNIEK